MNIQLYLLDPKNKNNIFEIKGNQLLSLNKEVFELQERINSGGNAVIYSCLNSSGYELAVKFFLKVKSPIQLKRFQQEIRTLKNINHPHLIRYINEGSLFARNLGDNQEYQIPFLIMEKADKNLKDFIMQELLIPYEIYYAQFVGLAQALSFLHSNEIVHRDIKPENILIKGETWKISDLGLCSYLNENHLELTRDREKVGPTYWLSPEAINKHYIGNDEIIKCSDVFQLCQIFWFVVNKRHPLGQIVRDDWSGPGVLFRIVYDSLLYNNQMRIANGALLHEKLIEARL